MSFYVQARERISRYAIHSIEQKKFGGPGSEVMIDILKLGLRTKKGRGEERLVLGFIEHSTGRMRAYLVPNIKPHTITQFLAKTVAQHSILYTPFYSQTGWEFLDKYFETRRLVSQKHENYAYEYERKRFGDQSGFHFLWESIRNVEILWLRFMQNMRRYGKVHENL